MKTQVIFIRSNGIYDIFHVVSTRFVGYVEYLRSGNYTVEDVRNDYTY